MKIRNLVVLTLLIVPLGVVAMAQGIETPNDWEVIGNGIEFQQYHLSDPVPVNIFVTRMDRDNPNVTIDSSIAQGRLSGGLETVGRMAERYDQALNNWRPPTEPISQTWGSRNDVVVAINGYFFDDDIEPPGVPWSGQIHSGWYAKRFYNFSTDTSGSGFAWRQDRSVFIGGCVSHPLEKQFVDFSDWAIEELQFIDAVNVPRADNELVLYTPQYDRDTNTSNESTSLEVLVEMEKPTMLDDALNMPTGIVQQIRKGLGSTPIPFDHIVLSAHGTAAKILQSNIQKGDRIGINQKIKHFLQDKCNEKNPEDWVGVYASLAGSYFFLRNDDIYDFSHELDATFRKPRTAIAYNDEHIFFIVADGRDPGISEGMTVDEMADFVKNTLKATNAIMQDGGGSSTMVIKEQDDNNTLQVVNNTFCNNTFPHCFHVYLPLGQNSSTSIASSAFQSPHVEFGPDMSVATQILQRFVANGIMMVVVEPKKQSETYSQGNLVATTSESNLYLGPGTNYGVLTSVWSGSIGEITAHTKELDGVLAKNSYWWQVEFEDVTGWVSEESLTAQLKSAPAVWRKDANQIR